MKTTIIKQKEDFEFIGEAIDWLQTVYCDTTVEVKVVMNPQSKKFAVQVVDLTNE